MVVINVTGAEVSIVEARVSAYAFLRTAGKIFSIAPSCKVHGGKNILHHMLSIIPGFEIWFLELLVIFKEDYTLSVVDHAWSCRTVERILEANPDDKTATFRGSRALFAHYEEILPVPKRCNRWKMVAKSSATVEAIYCYAGKTKITVQGPG